jgi:hypothetical protein
VDVTIEYQLLPERALAVVHASGDVDALEILAEGARMFAESDWQAGFSILLDYRRITSFAADSEQIRKIVEQDSNNAPVLEGSRCAVVADKDYVYGLARMWEILSESSALQTMVFRDHDQALAWLGIEASALPPPPQG